MSDARRRSTALPPLVRQLGSVSFFNDFASEMVYPLLPVLVTSRLGGTAIALGALDGISEAVSAVLKVASGWLSERPRWRRPLVVGGYLMAALVRPAMGVASAAWQVVALRATDRLGKGARTPPRDAILADVTPPAMRGRAFGFHRAMDHAGAVAGPLAAWLMLSVAHTGPEEVLRWSLVPGVVAVGVAVWALRRAEIGPRVASAQAEPRRDAPEARPEESAADANMLFGLIVGFAFARFPETLVLLRLQDLGVQVAGIPILWAVMHLVRSLTSYPGGWLSDSLGPRRVLVLGWLVYAVVCFGLSAAASAAAAIGWFLVFGLVAAATESPERAFVAAMGSGGKLGRRFGAYHAAVGLAALPGSLLLGALYAHSGARLALHLSGVLTAALAVVSLARSAAAGRRG